MVARRAVILDPAGRRSAELVDVCTKAGLIAGAALGPVGREATIGCDLVLLTPGAAERLAAPLPDDPPRWIVGEAGNPARIAQAAMACGAVGALVLPVVAAAIAGIAAATSSADDITRLRALVAVSLLGDGEDDDTVALAALAAAFAADDCIAWWRDGDNLVPHGARDGNDHYRADVAAAARIAAATTGTTITTIDGATRSVIAAALRAGPGEVAGILAIVADRGRAFTAAERADLIALAERMTRELGHLARTRRLTAEGDRLRAASHIDPLTGALTRAAFEQAVTTQVAVSARRKEALSFLLLDVAGLRRINLEHGHRAGDEVLSQVAMRVRAAVRGSDPLGRFGGDELGLLLSGADVGQAQVVIDKIWTRLATPIIADGAELTVALRVALTAVAAGERSGEAAFARALAALRTARPGGVVIAPADARADGELGMDHAALAAGATLGGTFRILHELSRGAMGVVYRGEDLGLGRAVAIKVLRSDLASDSELVTKFRAEAAMLASLHHPNLVQVYALGAHGGDVYFVMELVEGQPLAEVLRDLGGRGERLPPEIIRQITLEIADALDAMHEVGLIHRDVKPANILLDRDKDRAVLVDVGVAMKAGDRVAPAGTPGYAAPESFLDAAESSQTDVYGLGSTVYTMLTGQTPYGSGAVASVVTRQLHEPLTPPSMLRAGLSSAVDAVIAKALAPSPARRWASASAFAVALGAALERLAQQAPPPPSRMVGPGTAAADVEEVDDDATSETPMVRVFPGLGEAATADAIGTPRPRPSDTNDPPRPPRAAAQVLASTVVLDATAAAARPPPTERDLPSDAVPLPLGHLRGAHFRIASRVISHRLGPTALRELAEARPALAPLIAATLPPFGWEPVERYVEILRWFGGRLAVDDTARLIGRGTVTATFTRFYGANPASLQVETVLRSAPAFWGRYHSWCRIEVSTITRGSVELAVLGRPGDPVMCHTVAGELERIAELAGGREASCTFASCGAPASMFVVRWT